MTNKMKRFRVDPNAKEAGEFFKKLAQRKAIGTPAPGIVPRSKGRAGGNGLLNPARLRRRPWAKRGPCLGGGYEGQSKTLHERGDFPWSRGFWL
jgi:hypothetical protein